MKDIQLYEFQSSAVEDVRNQIRAGQRNIVLAMPTGSGKTVIATYLLEECHNKMKRAIFVADRINLIDQTSAMLDEYGVPHGVIQAQHWRWRPWERIHVASAATLEKRAWPSDTDLIIVDECFPPDMEVLTEIGFVRFDSLPKEAKCAQYQDGRISFVMPTEHIDKAYRGPMVHLWSQTRHNVSMTPDHELLRFSLSRGRWEKVAVKNAALNGFYQMAVAGEAIGSDSGISPLERLMIAHQADGNLHNVTAAGHTLAFTFVKQRKIARLMKIIMEGGYRSTEVKCSAGKRRFMVFDVPSGSKHIRDTFGSLANMGSVRARAIIEEMVQWDGHKGKTGFWYYSSVVKDNADFYQEACVLAGYRTNMTVQRDDRSCNFNDVYRLFILRDTPTVDAQNITKTVTHYEGRVYCIRVPSGNIIVRRNGKCLVIGNCHATRKHVTDRIARRDCVTIGLTATPFTKGLGKHYDAIVTVTTTNKLIAQKYLSPFRVFAASEPDMRGVKVVAGEWAEDETATRAMPIIGDCVAEYLKHGEGKKFICFGVNVAHCAESSVSCDQGDVSAAGT